MSLTIQDLPVEQHLDREAMRALRGGSLFLNSAVNAILNHAQFSFASPNIIAAPVTQVDASTTVNIDLSALNNVMNNLGGILKGFQH